MPRMMRADEDLVGQRRDPGHDDAVAHHAQQEHPDDGTDDGALATAQHRPADDRHGDDLQLVAVAAVGVGSDSRGWSW